MMTGMDTPAVIRFKRKPCLFHRVRSFEILCDGTTIGAVANGEERVCEVAPGKHSLLIKTGWMRSQQTECMLNPGQTLLFECGVTWNSWKLLLAFAIFIASLACDSVSSLSLSRKLVFWILSLLLCVAYLIDWFKPGKNIYLQSAGARLPL